MAPVAENRKGRPAATSHGEIERAAFRLFAERGFEGTTLDDVAEAVGVGRRTLFRYYRSKNDIPWGQFHETLEHFAAVLRQSPRETSLLEAVHRGVVVFNTFPADVTADHRRRMRLILETPELQAYSALQYTAWRTVISTYIAERLDVPESSPLPQVVGHVSLGLALSAYEAWLADDDSDLVGLLDDCLVALRTYVQ